MWCGVGFSLAFTGAIHFAKPLLPEIAFAADTGASHYYWKLPEADAITRLSAWGSYLIHQCLIWFLIWKAQRGKLLHGRIASRQRGGVWGECSLRGVASVPDGHLV